MTKDQSEAGGGQKGKRASRAHLHEQIALKDSPALRGRAFGHKALDDQPAGAV